MRKENRFVCGRLNPFWYYCDENEIEKEGKKLQRCKNLVFHFSFVTKKAGWLILVGRKKGYRGEKTWDEFYSIFEKEYEEFARINREKRERDYMSKYGNIPL